MNAIRVLGILVASVALIGVAEAQKGGGKPGGKNTPPTGSISDISVTVNSPDTVIDLYAAYSDAQDPDTALAYAVTGNTNPTLFNSVTIDSASGTLTLSYATDAVGVADVTVQVTDTGGRSLNDTFSVEVVGSVVFEENFNYGFEKLWTSDPAFTFNVINVIQKLPPTISFSEDGTSLLLLNKETPTQTSNLFTSVDTFGTDVEIEARVKTAPLQDATINAELQFVLFAVNTQDPSKGLNVYLHFGCYQRCIEVWVQENDQIFLLSGVTWEWDTWYRVRITDDTVGGSKVTLQLDDGTIVGERYLTQSLSAIGDSFKVGFGSATGFDPNKNQTATVDYIRVCSGSCSN